jgi:hypothetical protein
VAFYNYQCSAKSPCKVKQLTRGIKKSLVIEKHKGGVLIWTIQHGMNETPTIKCPVCSKNAVKTLYGANLTTWVRGNCYLNRKDCKRQMDLRLLESNNDPYKSSRQSGEVDELKNTLRKKKIPRR